MLLDRLAEHDGVDRRQAQVGEEAGVLIDRGSMARTPMWSARSVATSRRISDRVRSGTIITVRLLLPGSRPRHTRPGGPRRRVGSGRSSHQARACEVAVRLGPHRTTSTARAAVASPTPADLAAASWRTGIAWPTRADLGRCIGQGAPVPRRECRRPRSPRADRRSTPRRSPRVRGGSRAAIATATPSACAIEIGRQRPVARVVDAGQVGRPSFVDDDGQVGRVGRRPRPSACQIRRAASLAAIRPQSRCDRRRSGPPRARCAARSARTELGLLQHVAPDRPAHVRRRRQPHQPSPWPRAGSSSGSSSPRKTSCGWRKTSRYRPGQWNRQSSQSRIRIQTVPSGRTISAYTRTRCRWISSMAIRQATSVPTGGRSP